MNELQTVIVTDAVTFSLYSWQVGNAHHGLTQHGLFQHGRVQFSAL